MNADWLSASSNKDLRAPLKIALTLALLYD